MTPQIMCAMLILQTNPNPIRNKTRNVAMQVTESMRRMDVPDKQTLPWLLIYRAAHCPNRQTLSSKCAHSSLRRSSPWDTRWLMQPDTVVHVKAECALRWIG